jgi:hypothetical protein
VNISIGSNMSPTDYARSGMDALARHNIGARLDPATAAYAFSGAYDCIYVDIHANHQRAGKHNSVRINRVHRQYRVSWPELIQQPTRVIDSIFGYQSVQYLLIIPMAVLVTKEPTVPRGARILGFNEFFGKLHNA